MSLASRAKVLSGYRRLFKARKFLFQEDKHALNQSRLAIRDEFLKHQHVTDPNTISNLLVSIDEAEDMMRHGIVQGKRNDDTGNIEVKIKAEHTQAMEQNPSIAPLHNEQNISDETDEIVITKTKPNDN